MADRRAEVDVFSAEPRSFKMDRRSPEATALREAVSCKLLEFLGTYSDKILTDYIIVLVCNGKHQNQARDDLEAFLGKDSANFVAWLWDYLSIKISVSKLPFVCSDGKTKKSSHTNSIEDSDRYNNYCPSKISSVEGQADEPQEKAPTVHSNVHVANSNQSGSKIYIDGSLMSSTRTVSDGEQCLKHQNQHQKIAKSTSSELPCQPLTVPKTEKVTMNPQPTIREDMKPRPTVKSVISCRPSADDADVVEAQVSRLRGNVWDRLGKPCKDNEAILRVEKYHPFTTKKLNCTYRSSGNEIEKVAVSDEGHKRIFFSNHLQEHGMQEHSKQGSFEHVDKLKRTRPDLSNISASCSGSQEVIPQDKVASQSTRGSLPSKRLCLSRPNDLATDEKSKSNMIPDPACTSTKSISEWKLQSDKVVQSPVMKRSSAKTALKNSIPHCCSTSEESKSVKHACGNSESQPMQNEILKVKSKLQQVERHIQELRSKQANLNNLKPMTPSGRQNISKEDVESRTVSVTNVHFAASREALLSHFAKCGPIAEVTMLTEITGQPKGEAYIIFANKESVEKAILLSGTSFFSRILMVAQKPEFPSSSSTAMQLAPMLAAPALFLRSSKEGDIQRPHTSSHFQWKRDESAAKKSSAPASTTKSESSNAGE